MPQAPSFPVVRPLIHPSPGKTRPSGVELVLVVLAVRWWCWLCLLLLISDKVGVLGEGPS